MTEHALIEALADKEHSSWARWMEYLFSQCDLFRVPGDPGAYVIPARLVSHWRGQLLTPYALLSEREKQMDRDEVAHILPIIQAYCAAQHTEKGDQG